MNKDFVPGAGGKVEGFLFLFFFFFFFFKEKKKKKKSGSKMISALKPSLLGPRLTPINKPDPALPEYYI